MAAESNQMTLPAVPEAPQQNGMVAMMERLAMNPNLPVEKLRELLTMQMEIRADEAKREFAAAMARVQSKMPQVTRGKDNQQTGSKYAPLEKIIEIAAPIYTAEGFSISFSEAVSPTENHVRVIGILRHAHGHSTEHYRDVAIDKTGIAGKVNKTDTHAEASSITYGRRYVTCLAFNISTGDDKDGNKPGDKITEEQAVRLRAMMTEFGVEEPKFLEALQLETLEEMPAAGFSAARVALKARAKAKKPEAAK